MPIFQMRFRRRVMRRHHYFDCCFACLRHADAAIHFELPPCCHAMFFAFRHFAMLHAAIHAFASAAGALLRRFHYTPLRYYAISLILFHFASAICRRLLPAYAMICHADTLLLLPYIHVNIYAICHIAAMLMLLPPCFIAD